MDPQLLAYYLTKLSSAPPLSEEDIEEQYSTCVWIGKRDEGVFEPDILRVDKFSPERYLVQRHLTGDHFGEGFVKREYDHIPSLEEVLSFLDFEPTVIEFQEGPSTTVKTFWW